jgi:hypothetical protein
MSIRGYALYVSYMHIIVTAKGDVWRARGCWTRKQNVAPAIARNNYNSVFVWFDEAADGYSTDHAEACGLEPRLRAVMVRVFEDS